jgi:DNA primase
MPVIEQIKERIELVDLVAEHVTLIPSGRNLKAPCPFHSERTPSFFVFPEHQTWRCFGACAEGGDIFSFLMKHQGIEFPEAIKTLARRAGLTVPSRKNEERKNPIFHANEVAAQFYQDILSDSQLGREARVYLSDRGLDAHTIQQFRLGLSPNNETMLKNHLANLGYDEALLAKAGLISQTQARGTRDAFRGRLMFPIRDQQGRVVGFGARTLNNGTPKYLNTARTEIFDKGSLLYAIEEAATPISEEGSGIIVEGYMDALLAHQHGFRNVVASMGTSLTQQQVVTLRRLADRFVLALDPDTAGQEATLRSLETSWKVLQPNWSARREPPTNDNGTQMLELKMAILPEGSDPAELIRKDAELWLHTVSTAPSLLEFLFMMLPSRYDLTTPRGRMHLAERLGPLILNHTVPGQQDKFLTQLESLVGISRNDLASVLGTNRQGMLNLPMTRPRSGSVANQGYIAPFLHALHDPLEEYTIALLLQYPRLADHVGQLNPSLFTRAENKALFNTWAKCDTIEQLKESIDEVLVEHLDNLLALPLPSTELKQRTEALSQCIQRLEEHMLRELKLQEGVLLTELEERDFDQASLERALERNRRLRQLHLQRSRQTGY